MRRSYSRAWANAGVFQTLLTSGPGTVCRGDGTVHCRTPSSLSGFGPLDANSTCSQLQRPNSSPDFTSCSLRVKSLPPALENPESLETVVFSCGSRKGLARGPPGGGDQTQMCRSDPHAAAGWTAMCSVSRGAPETVFPPSGRCWQILRMTRLLRAVRGDDTCGCLD